ncbi:MAG: NADH-quinone oxidoreductase subunit D-related protein [Candidatus Dormibacteria bacterium]
MSVADATDALISAGARLTARRNGLATLEGGDGAVAALLSALAQPDSRGPRLLDLWGDEHGAQRLLIGSGAEFLLHHASEAPNRAAPQFSAVNAAAHCLEREMLAMGSTPEGGHDLAPPQPLMEVKGRGVFTIPFGPVRSGVVESMLHDVATAGEDMLAVVPRTGFKRRGLETRLCEVPLDMTGTVAERIAGVFSVAGAYAVCSAIEAAAGAEVDPQAQAVRGVLAELERIHNHCDSIMKLCDDASLAVGNAQMAILKERVLRILAALTGHRYGRGVVVPGGVSRGLRGTSALAQSLRDFGRDSVVVRRLLLGTGSFLDRLERTGALAPADAAAMGASGPVARGSQLPWDARQERPHGPYALWPIPAAVMSDCDVMARFEVRIAEIRHSLRWIVDVIRDVDVESPPPPVSLGVEPSAIGIGWVEAPEGEWIAIVEGGRDGRLGRARVRPAALLNFGCFRRACEGWVLTDFAFIEHSFGLCVAGCDR